MAVNLRYLVVGVLAFIYIVFVCVGSSSVQYPAQNDITPYEAPNPHVTYAPATNNPSSHLPPHTDVQAVTKAQPVTKAPGSNSHTGFAQSDLRTDKDFYIFVGGAHGSGTSLLHFALAEHPFVYGFEDTNVPMDEGQHLQSVFPKAYSCKNSVISSDPRYFTLGFGMEGCRETENSKYATQASRKALLEDWQPWWDRSRLAKRDMYPELDEEARIWIEKSPPDLVRSRLLHYYFPNSLTIQMVRHPLNVLGGVYESKRTYKYLYEGVENWLEEYRVAREDAATLGKSVLFLWYEDFLCSPVERMQEIASLVGLEIPEGMVEHKDSKNCLSPSGRRLFSSKTVSGRGNWGTAASSLLDSRSEGTDASSLQDARVRISPAVGRRQPLFKYHGKGGDSIVVDSQYMWSNIDQVEKALKQAAVQKDLERAMDAFEETLNREYGYSLQPPYVLPCPVEDRRKFSCGTKKRNLIIIRRKSIRNTKPDRIIIRR
eukprot:Rmarinus@m.19806